MSKYTQIHDFKFKHLKKDGAHSLRAENPGVISYTQYRHMMNHAEDMARALAFATGEEHVFSLHVDSDRVHDLLTVDGKARRVKAADQSFDIAITKCPVVMYGPASHEDNIEIVELRVYPASMEVSPWKGVWDRDFFEGVTKRKSTNKQNERTIRRDRADPSRA